MIHNKVLSKVLDNPSHVISRIIINDDDKFAFSGEYEIPGKYRKFFKEQIKTILSNIADRVEQDEKFKEKEERRQVYLKLKEEFDNEDKQSMVIIGEDNDGEVL